MIPPQRKENMVAKMHRTHLPKVGEGVIYLPSGMPFEADDTPLYPAGAYMRLGNKEFIYAIAGDTLNTDLGAMNSRSQAFVEQDCAEEVAAGVTEFKVTIAATHNFAKDVLAGGQFIAFPGSENTFRRGIVSSSLIETSGELTLVLDSPTPCITPAGKWCEAIYNPYNLVKNNQGDWAMVMGMPTVPATVGQGLWLQVSGPNWAAPVYGASGPGGAVKVLECVFVGNGSIAVRGAGADKDRQLAGVVIATKSGGGQASPFIMLQIAH